MDELAILTLLAYLIIAMGVGLLVLCVGEILHLHAVKQVGNGIVVGVVVSIVAMGVVMLVWFVVAVIFDPESLVEECGC